MKVVGVEVVDGVSYQLCISDDGFYFHRKTVKDSLAVRFRKYGLVLSIFPFSTGFLLAVVNPVPSFFVLFTVMWLFVFGCFLIGWWAS